MLAELRRRAGAAVPHAAKYSRRTAIFAIYRSKPQQTRAHYVHGRFSRAFCGSKRVAVPSFTSRGRSL